MSQTTTTIYRATAATSQRQHTLTAADRCDQCRARAYVSFIADSGTVLLLCGHHFSRHEEAITARGYLVRDERDQLYSATASGTGLPSPAGR